MEISQDCTISFSTEISADLGLKENNVILLFKSDLPFRVGSGKFVFYQVYVKGNVLAASINTVS